MKIRGIAKADFDHVVAVLDRWWGGPSSERAHPVFFYELGEQALIAEEDGEMVGFLLGFIAPTAPKTAYVHLVGIHPDRRRRGVGKELYERFAERAREAGAARVKAITTVGNEGSVRFHEALGFTVTEDPDYAGPGRSRIVFTKDL
ncbi:MAG: GNAT family N-acetyltransferase [Sandaracinaceae bacterium]|nr:GNAT family N-acetyltransferase [Sandaracinaceae bacterium]MCC6877269.1 GNAT family N-acetyltransferase [Sandaracinaceae bacterium]